MAGEAANNGADEAVEDDLVTFVEDTISVTEESPDAELKFTCDSCDYSLTSQKGLNVHKSAKHKGGKKIRIPE